MKRNRNRRHSGFTLVELLIVLGILVMLLAIVGPRVLRSGKKADVNVAKSQIASFKAILQTYHVDMKSYPSTEQGLAALYRRPENLEEGSPWDGPYGDGSQIPRDPWSNEYLYEYPSTHGQIDYPDIWSVGPDGEDGTEDDITNWVETDETGEATMPEGTSSEPSP